jgi:hypothetical protein
VVCHFLNEVSPRLSISAIRIGDLIEDALMVFQHLKKLFFLVHILQMRSMGFE